MKPIRDAIKLLLPLLLASTAQAATVVVLTSFPPELTSVYKKAFERRHPEMTVEFVNKNTSAALSVIRGNPNGLRPDVFWASAPDAFETMAHEHLFEKAPETRNPAIPPRIGRYPMDDPEGMYYGQALSGYGIMWNKRYIQAHKLPVPAQWSDLAAPAYFGHVGMSSPSRSGTTHMTVETLLQGEGWDRGWSLLLQIAGNCAAISGRSTDVPEDVASGKVGVGLVIDFFGLSAKYTGAPVEFAYPTVTAVVPASIALIRGAKNTEGGKQFMAFALSRAGQELLLEPKISRIPAMQSGDFFDSVPGTYPNIYGVAHRAKVTFDTRLAQGRITAVSQLFDQAITLPLSQLQAATKAIHAAELQLSQTHNAKAAEMLRRARELAYAPPMAEKQLLSQKPGWTPESLPVLQSEIRERYRHAQELATEAVVLAGR
jgi:ABC-type Fe3+ transport system substrate-binding protein